jgi:hypothetical protein
MMSHDKVRWVRKFQWAKMLVSLGPQHDLESGTAWVTDSLEVQYGARHLRLTVDG